MKTEKLLYVGGFEMPDGNAAAQRVLAIAKALPDDYNVEFLGLTHCDNYTGTVAGYEYTNLPYPSSKKEWVEHLAGTRELDYVKKEKPDAVIAYNYPALGLWRLLRYCKKSSIKLIADITEWYHPHNALKWIDTEWRMRILHKRLDGLIVISSYLADYYAANQIVKIPPTIDLQAPLWQKEDVDSHEGVIKLLYVGSPGRGDKDKLDTIIEAIKPYPNLHLIIVGINEEQYKQLYDVSEAPTNIVFKGRLTHESAVKELKKADFSIFFRDPTRVNNAGFPTKYAEAAAAGVPVITNHFSDIPKMIVQGKNGFIAENTPGSISDTIRVVAALSKDEIVAMKQYCREHNDFFDCKYYTCDLKAFFEDVCEQQNKTYEKD